MQGGAVAGEHLAVGALHGGAGEVDPQEGLALDGGN